MVVDYRIRPWKKSDAESLMKHANNFNIARYMKDVFPHPYSMDKAHQFIEFAMKGKPVHVFAIEVNGEAAGGIGVHMQVDVHRKNAELGYWLSEQYWGQGIITKAIKEVVDYAFKTFDIQRIFASTFGSNVASQKVLEKAGLHREGVFVQSIFKNGQFEDEIFYSIRRDQLPL